MASFHIYALTKPTNKTSTNRYTFYGMDRHSEVYECAIMGGTTDMNYYKAAEIVEDNFYMLTGYSISRANCTPFISMNPKQTTVSKKNQTLFM